MTSLCAAIVAGLLAATVPTVPQDGLGAVPGNAQAAIVRAYLNALERARYDAAFALLNGDARAYYRNVANFGSIFAADAYRITAFWLIGARGDERSGRVFFARETARFRDHAHDVDLNVTATVPIGVVPEGGGWRIKDPGHPWRAFAAHAGGDANGVRATVKKVSYFARRIETVVSFVNTGAAFVTLLPYGKSSLTDSSGHSYRLIKSRDWSLTDKSLFEGLRLAPNAEYTGTLVFECKPQNAAAQTFSLTIAPLLTDGADAPFAVRDEPIAAAR